MNVENGLPLPENSDDAGSNETVTNNNTSAGPRNESLSCSHIDRPHTAGLNTPDVNTVPKIVYTLSPPR